MIWNSGSRMVGLTTTALLSLCALTPTFPAKASAQLLSFPKQELIDYTVQNPFARLPDGRPKVPDDLLENARELSSEEIGAVLQQEGFNDQHADGFQVLHHGKAMAGLAFTVQFRLCVPMWTMLPTEGRKITAYLS
jgi:4-hydroxy-4-methyl-2-oxoglutarate aldolase